MLVRKSTAKGGKVVRNDIPRRAQEGGELGHGERASAIHRGREAGVQAQTAREPLAGRVGAEVVLVVLADLTKRGKNGPHVGHAFGGRDFGAAFFLSAGFGPS